MPDQAGELGAGAVLAGKVTSIDFTLPPSDAIAFFRDKGITTGFSFADLIGAEHDNAFTVAKIMDVDLLHDIRKAVDIAIADGTTAQTFAKQLIPELQKKGWWGRSARLDPVSGKRVGTTFAPWRLETIFRTNMQSAYSVGNWQSIQTNKKTAEYLMYDAVDDGRTRPEHRAWDNTVRPVDDPFWSTHYPPNGYNCRCGTIQLSQHDLDDLGLEVSEPPKIEYRDWKNPRTKRKRKIPKGIDPGFDRNAGKARKQTIRSALSDRAKGLPQDMARALLEGIRKYGA